MVKKSKKEKSVFLTGTMIYYILKNNDSVFIIRGCLLERQLGSGFKEVWFASRIQVKLG